MIRLSPQTRRFVSSLCSHFWKHKQKCKHKLQILCFFTNWKKNTNFVFALCLCLPLWSIWFCVLQNHKRKLRGLCFGDSIKRQNLCLCFVFASLKMQTQTQNAKHKHKHKILLIGDTVLQPGRHAECCGEGRGDDISSGLPPSLPSPKRVTGLCNILGRVFVGWPCSTQCPK